MCTFCSSSISVFLLVSLFVGLISAREWEAQNFSLLDHFLGKRASENNQIFCSNPLKPRNGKYIAKDPKTDEIIPMKSGVTFPRFTILELTCDPHYLTTEGYDKSESFCNRNGKWSPEAGSCYKICSTLHEVDNSVNLTCVLNDEYISCVRPLISGTKVYPACKAGYHSAVSTLDYSYTECLDNGDWDKPISYFTCILDCGISGVEKLIERGKRAPLDAFPWHVAVYQISEGYVLICGGTLITMTMVISAAHCFYDESRNRREPPDDFVIVTNKFTRDYYKKDNEYQQRFKVADIIFYTREYNPANPEGATVYDIAIIVLENPISISRYTLPACFPWNEKNGFDPGDGVLGVLAGWGRDENKLLSQELHMAELPYMKREVCAQKKIKSLTFDKFCTGSINGSRASSGDSGGGLLFKDSESKLFFLRGIVSAKDTYEKEALTTFTDVSIYWYTSWIENVRKDLESSAKWNVCGTSSYDNRVRNISGRNASSLGAWPWMVALMVYDSVASKLRYVCGGTLISNQWILTTAYCANLFINTKVNATARLGDLDLSDSEENHVKPIEMPIGKFVVHPEYKRPMLNNIAIVKMRNKVKFSEYIRPICLPSEKKYLSEDFYNNTTAYLTWWASKLRTRVSAIIIEKEVTKLFEITLPTVNNKVCGDAFKSQLKDYTEITDSVFCTKNYQDKLTCQGFSGCPVMFLNSSTKTFYLGGIISYGYECVSENPGVNVKVAKYIDWIRNTVDVKI